MTINFRYASFPLARREGPSNVATTPTKVALTDVEGTILPENNARASVILRNTSDTYTLFIFFQTGEGADGMTLEPQESITLENIKGEILGQYEASGSGEIRIIETET
jgi:hypothetical protein